MLLEIRALRYFQMVANCGSYSRGADMLRISQPAVSRTIRKLEDELGTAVFERHGHGVRLTPAGQILLERSQLLFRQLEQTRAEIRSGMANPSGVVSFAVTPAAGYVLAPPLVERFHAEYPNVFLNFVGGFSGYIHEWLVRGQVDVACLHDPLPQRGFEITPLLNEQVLLVGKPGSLPAGRAYARTADLANLPLIVPSLPNASRRLLDRWVAATPIPLNIKIEVNDHYVTRGLVKKGLGFTLLTRGAIAADLRCGELEAVPFRPDAYWPLALVTCANAPRSAVVEAFIRTVRSVTRELAASGAWPGKLLDRE